MVEFLEKTPGPFDKLHFDVVPYALMDGRVTPLQGGQQYIPPGDLKPVVDLVATGSTTIALQTDGTVRSWGKARTTSHRERAEWYESLQNISQIGDGFAVTVSNEVLVAPVRGGEHLPKVPITSILNERLGIFRFQNGIIEGKSPTQLANLIHSIDPRSELIDFAYERNRKSGQIRAVAMRFPDNRWRYFSDENRINSEVPTVGEAIDGAVTVQLSGPLIFALLPTDTVSRSGYWEAEDLIKDRQQLARRGDTPVATHTGPDEADKSVRSPFPLPLPEYPPEAAGGEMPDCRTSSGTQ